MSNFPISVADGKLLVLTPNCSRPRIEPERIDEFLNPEFVSRLAAKLWQGDEDASVSNAFALIECCAKELAWRKSPLSGITLSGNPPPKSFRQKVRFWKHFPLEVVIDVAATVGPSQQPDAAVKRAFSIIGRATTVLEKRSEGSVGEQQNDLATTPSNQLSSRHLGSDLTEELKFRWTWKEAAKRITGTKKAPGPAAKRLLTFLNDGLRSKSSGAELKRAIADREKNGFTLREVKELEKSYADWHPRYVKSRQSESGRKIGRKNLRKKSG